MVIISHMVIEIGAAKCGRFEGYGSDETCEVIERPLGGQSIVYCGGRRDGRSSKTISSVIVNKILEKTSESLRDSTAIKTVSDLIFREYAGSACGDLCMVSADFDSGTFVISRCTDTPVYYYQRGILNVWDQHAERIGSSRGLRPSITEIPIETGTSIVILSEGVLNAGRKLGIYSDVSDLLLNIADEESTLSADQTADFLLQRAAMLDHYKPEEDMTVIVMRAGNNAKSAATRLLLTCPVPEYQSIFD